MLAACLPVFVGASARVSPSCQRLLLALTLNDMVELYCPDSIAANYAAPNASRVAAPWTCTYEAQACLDSRADNFQPWASLVASAAGIVLAPCLRRRLTPQMARAAPP